ncbi:MAG: NAD-dependent DNA ligase LigA, partial [Planctomycetota bacterium]
MSSRPDPARRMAELAGRLDRYGHLYYVEGRSEISDEEYDQLYRELGALEQAHPELTSSASPTQRVGAPLPTGQGFEKVPHAVPMLSIESLFTRDEVGEFSEKIQRFLGLAPEEDLDWQVEPKFDGVSASLIYEQGHLMRAVTRGDGRVGEDVTANLRTIRNLPLGLSDEVRSVPELLEVRGEVLIARERFLAFNRQREAEDRPVLANARNAAAGAVRRGDPAQVARYPLEFHSYAAPRIEGGPLFETHAELAQALRDWGLPDSGFGRTVKGLPACFDYHDELEAKRDDLPFEVDGVVCKLDRLDLRERLGSTSRATRWQFAHKFRAVEAVSRLRAIEVQVGANGRLTPRAHVEPVEVQGVTVRHATLHNADHVASLGVRVGDQVFLKRAGDVIPKITGVASAAAGRQPAGWAASLPGSLSDPDSGALRPAVTSGWREEFSMPETCPACSTRVVVEGKHTRCPNLYECRPQVVGRTLLLTGRGGFEVDSIGEKMVEQLVQAGFLESPADLF